MSEPSQRSALLELGVTVVAPTLILVFLADEHLLGPVWSLVAALAFPVGHAVLTLLRSRTVNPITVLVLISVLLTGGIGVLEIDVGWFAWKEAALPLVLGVGALISAFTDRPAIPLLLDSVLDHDRVEALLEEHDAREAHESDMRRATIWLGLIMVATAVGTFAFARYMITSPTGTQAFSNELGAYTGWAFPVLGIPSTVAIAFVLRYVLVELEEHTGVPAEELVKG